jgi:predicted MFS family arabinose efflux permease
MHPLRTGLLAYVVVISAGVVSFFFIQGEMSFAICVTALYVAIAIFQAATGAIGPRLLPRSQYGQFNSAGAMVFNFGWAGAAWLCGSFLDHMDDYRYLFLWFVGFCSVGFVLMLMVFRDWKHYGGDEHYVAPLPPAVTVSIDPGTA